MTDSTTTFKILHIPTAKYVAYLKDSRTLGLDFSVCFETLSDAEQYLNSNLYYSDWGTLQFFRAYITTSNSGLINKHEYEIMECVNETI